MEKYLRHYAEPETLALNALIDSLPGSGQWENVLVIPACNETAGFLRPPPPCAGRSLMILVINESVSVNREVSSTNKALAGVVQARFELKWTSAPEFGLSLFRDPLAQRDVLMVDRFSDDKQLPVKGGVGLARKIGADLAAGLIHRQCIRSPWIHCSDADVSLPETYFTCSDAVRNPAQNIDPEFAALVYPFHHFDDQGRAEYKEVFLATQLYELSLRYYVAGMRFARSPYAFHTVGSSMAVNARHYTKVRGFPKREAGEDFYILNKLAKVGSVLELTMGPDCEAIRIAARRSDRVPFGTGAAVNKITDLTDPVSEFRYYDPVVFELLQFWLQSLPAIWQLHPENLNESVFVDQSEEQQDRQQSLLAGLRTIGVNQALEHAFRQSKDLEQFMRQMHTWFDAFRTLKLIHYLRDFHLPSVSYFELESSPTYLQLLKLDPDLLAFYEQLRLDL